MKSATTVNFIRARALVGRRTAQASVLLAFAAIAAAQTPAPSPSPAPPAAAAEAALLKAEDALFAADVHHDVAAIEHGFADEAIFVHANGLVQTKADYLQATAKGVTRFVSMEAENRVVRIFGKVGVVRGIKNLVLDNGMHKSGSYLTVYVMREGRWQMLDEQSAPAPPPEGK